MQNEFLTDEDIYGTLDEHAAEFEMLHNKIDDLKMKLEDKTVTINELKKKITNDIDVNKRCLAEELGANTIEILNIWIKYDKELLEIINYENR